MSLYSNRDEVGLDAEEERGWRRRERVEKVEKMEIMRKRQAVFSVPPLCCPWLPGYFHPWGVKGAACEAVFGKECEHTVGGGSRHS